VTATVHGDHRYDDLFPNTISPEHRKRVDAFEREYLTAVDAIDPTALNDNDRTSWEIFRRDRVTGLEALRFPDHLMPVDQLFSVPVVFVEFAVPGGLTPFETAEDYDEFLSRIDGFAVWMDQAVTNMREGVERGVVLPEIIVDKTLPVLESQIVTTPEESDFYRAVREFPDTVSESERTRLRGAYAAAIETEIIPAYRKVHDFLRDEYRPHARQTIGLSDLPDGEAWYRFAIRLHANSEQTPQEIHDVGLREVERIRGEMELLAAEVGFGGDLTQLFAWLREQKQLRYSSEDDVLERYRAIRARVEPHLGKLFSLQPRTEFEIRPVEPFRQATTPGAYYMPPSDDGTRPGVFFVNTGGWEWREHSPAEALFLHEAVPGHHFQVALAREMTSLPRFRRASQYTAYVEGWALYTESLGAELGVYKDPFQRLGRLRSKMFRAQRLVVDTGIHALGWTRERALAQMPMEVEIDRYIVLPGQALAYKSGELRIQALRRRAERELGDRFDIRAFHAVALEEGAL
ncbi:MAG: DUF885 domain-containing protein, partial [Candidatus Eisenbacteria bacterium]